MLETVGRAVRRMGAAVLILTAPLGGMAITGAAAQIPPGGVPGMPTMGASVALTPELVAAWAQSYPEVVALSEQLEAQYGVPAGEDPMAGLAAIGMVTAANAQLTAVVAQYGFTDFAQWTNVTLAVAFAYAALQAPAEQQPMLMAMFQVTQDNMNAVNANLEAVAAVIDE